MSSRTLAIEPPLPDWIYVSSLMRNQVFTPSGRYGISIISTLQAGSIGQKRITVVDLAEQKVHRYEFANDFEAFVKGDFHYCLNEFQLLVLYNDYDGKGFIQQIVHLNHENKTFEIIKTRTIATTRNTNFQLNVHSHGHSATSVKYEGEDYLVWYPHPLSDADPLVKLVVKLFLIPKDPNSKAEVKLFYTRNTLPSNNHEAIHYYRGKYDTEISPLGIATVIDGKLCFSIGNQFAKAIMNVYLCVDITKLVNVYGEERVNIEELTVKQEPAYSIISTPRGAGNVESFWPLCNIDYYSNGNIFYHWRHSKQHKKKVVKHGSSLIVDGNHQTIDYQLPKELRCFSKPRRPKCVQTVGLGFDNSKLEIVENQYLHKTSYFQ